MIEAPSRLARQLGYAGVLPFALLACGCWLPAPFGLASQHALLDYAAVILGFLGAVHWGLALHDPKPAPERLVGGVLPSLVGWLALSLPPLAAFTVLATGFAAWLLWERRLGKEGRLSPWYLRLRGNLTLAVLMSLGVGAAAVSG